MILTIFSQAGGVGKSTTALNLLFTLKEAGINNVTIVTNEQAHGLNEIISKSDYVVLPERGTSIPKEYLTSNKDQVIIFDFAGKTDERIKSAALASDHVLIPTKGESSNKIQQFIQTVNDISDYTSKITILLTSYKKVSKSNKRLFEMAGDLLYKYPTYPIKHSEAFNQIWDEKRSVRAMWTDGGLNGRNYEEPKEHFNDLVKHLFGGNDE
ncbi:MULTISPECIES: ParA family protein [unclassified Pseudoalteromonas]|uniref:ParA family protein n=3 Tax=Pseudoalteromonas TaxID=53246 RepID=UPI001F1FE807|nr:MULTISPECIES: ParA family protein [unclassified Pseudoalteromonas]MCF2829725.1 ParA family protein [Pseudoalteromonas sp. OF5H-5]MCF2927615.1 ParA family protein [Pseudoalteromonas sp. DL2-H1]